MTAPPLAPLVLLPGMNCSARLWQNLALEASTTPRLTEPTLAGQVDRLLDELPERFALAGLSLGAIVAMAVARTAPERVERLALLSTNPHAPTSAQQAAWAEQRRRLAEGVTARQLQGEWLSTLLLPETVSHRPDVVDATLSMADEVTAAELDAQLALQSTRIDERPGLSRLGCPTLVVAARGDRLCPVRRHEELARLIPGAASVVVEDCGHLSPLEQPARIRTALSEWWADVRCSAVRRGR